MAPSIRRVTLSLHPFPFLDRVQEFESVASITYSSIEELKEGKKAIVDHNREILKPIKAARQRERLTARLVAFERARDLWSRKQGTWIAIDFEEWVHDHSIVTELGVSAIRWIQRGGVEGSRKEVLEDKHYMVGRRNYLNGKYGVDDNRTNYDFGQSLIVPIHVGFGKVMNELLRRSSQFGPVFLVFHDSSGDLMTLHDIGVNIEPTSPDLPASAVNTGLFVIDTNDVFAALVGDELLNKINLERMCNHLGIPNVKHLHNAGNDAHFTMAALKSMLSGATADIQREQRWPNQTAPRFQIPVKSEKEGPQDRKEKEEAA